ncbi:MAG: alpha/beta fold hydrolase [Planctomycetia bacterium]|nr:alpha/beta fold hydrolase [Planctomycetia bacterium]
MTSIDFQPHRLLRTGHLQTLAGVYWPHRRDTTPAHHRRVVLGDGDQLVLHDDCPPGWQPGQRAALLIHGLAGCHASPYMQRIAAKLNARGVRAFRMDLRGCGAGFGLARMPYHSGRSEDAAAALSAIGELCPGSPVALVGFSLGGNITLKLVGESAASLPANLDRAMAVCPPVDLLTCVRSLARGVNRFYDRHFVQLLVRQVFDLRARIPDAPGLPANVVPRGVFDFDEMFTAPVCGFGTALNYYRLCSSAQFVPEIRLPTQILAAADDPLVPGAMFGELRLSPAVHLALSRSGGHLGFIARRNGDPDRRWMDWRVVDWCV